MLNNLMPEENMAYRTGKVLQMKTLIAATFIVLCFSANAQTTDCKVVVDASGLRLKINKNIYGQFSEHLGGGIYDGIWVGEQSTIPNTNGIRNDVVAALRTIKVPVLRWPGGCFADEYRWKDGIGPREGRPAMVNTNWGGVTENNSFGTHGTWSCAGSSAVIHTFAETWGAEQYRSCRNGLSTSTPTTAARSRRFAEKTGETAHGVFSTGG